MNKLEALDKTENRMKNLLDTGKYPFQIFGKC